MKQARKVGLVGFMVFLALIFVLGGIILPEAKRPPKWTWRAGIPNEPMATQMACNLYANPHGNQGPGSPGYITYASNDFVEIDFWTSEDKDTGRFHSIFSLKIRNTEKGVSEDPGYYSVGFRDIWFSGCKTYCYLGGEGPCRCWVFPNYGLNGVDCCVPLCCGPTAECGSDGFGIMKQYMETSAHPRDGYDHFGLRFWVDTNIESIGVGDTWTGEGYMWWLNIWNTGETLVTGSEQYHNIVCDYTIPLEGIQVYRAGQNEWIITIDQCGPYVEGEECPPSAHGHSGRYIVFWETYYQGIEKQVGKSGKTSIVSEYRPALGGATRFKFQTIWTRTQ